MVNPGEDPQNGKRNKNGETGQQGFMSHFAGIGQTWLAIALIVPGFILIGYMLYIQQTVTNTTIDKVGVISDQTLANANMALSITALTTYYQQVNTSNQNLFAIILPVLGTWIGAVVAFYFGAQNLKQSQESFKDAKDLIDKSLTTTPSPTTVADYKTIGELLEKVQGATGVIIVTMESTIKQVKEVFKNNSGIDNVVVVRDSTNKKNPMGVLYKDDFQESIGAIINQEQEIDNQPLGDLIHKITEDMITEKPWTQEDGADNYAKLYESDTLGDALAKMEQVGGEHNNMTRGLVLDSPDERTVIGIVEDSMLATAAPQKGLRSAHY